MSLFVVDVEADGPCPGLYSMVSFGAVKVDTELKTTFFGQGAPISDKWIPEALAISNISREQHLAYPDFKLEIVKFHQWVKLNSKGRAILISDNNGFDAPWLTYYFALYGMDNPFGFSSRRIGDFYSGLQKDFYASSKWKSMRKTKHTHNPVDDCLGNAEALIEMCRQYNIKLPS